MILEIKKGKHGKGRYYVCKCDWCGDKFERMESAFKGQSKKHFCGARCYGNWKAENYIPWNLGKKDTLSKEGSKKMSGLAKKRFTGKKQSAEHIRKRVESFKGYKHSEASRKKMSENWADKRGKNNPSFGKFGEASTNWKGGRRETDEGYIYKYAPNHPNNVYKYVLEHRLVMEKEIGRYLQPEEIVHHINGVVDDNRSENLKLFKDAATHRKHHASRVQG